jgi:hypothetical protein
MSDKEVWGVVKEAMNYLSDDCFMKIIIAAKEEGLKGNKIFMPLVETVEFAGSLDTSIKYTTKED